MISKPFLSAGIVVLLLLIGLIWLNTNKELTAIEILAPHDIDKAQPVYGTHSFTQSFILLEQANVTAVSVPLYIPAKENSLQLTLSQDKRLIAQWPYQPVETGSVMARFDVNPPQTLEAKLELEFKAAYIRPQDKEKAPRLFTEAADDAYPAGNYRIAANEKKGDIALTVWQHKSQWKLFTERFFENPLKELSTIGYSLLIIILAGSVPYTRKNKSPHTNNKG